MGARQAAHLPASAADNRCFRNERNLLHRVVYFRHETAKRQMIILRAMKCEGENWNIIDGFRFNERKGNPVRYPVKVSLQLLV